MLSLWLFENAFILLSDIWVIFSIFFFFMSKGAMSLLEHVSWCIYAKVSLHKIRSDIAGSWRKHMPYFSRLCHSSCTNIDFCQQCLSVPIILYCCIIRLLNFYQWNDFSVTSYCGISISMITMEGALFMFESSFDLPLQSWVKRSSE